jgi:hypothetical protein
VAEETRREFDVDLTLCFLKFKLQRTDKHGNVFVVAPVRSESEVLVLKFVKICRSDAGILAIHCLVSHTFSPCP